MKIKSTSFKDLKIINSPIYSDKRGNFREIFQAKFFKKIKFVFSCMSVSKKMFYVECIFKLIFLKVNI